MLLHVPSAMRPTSGRAPSRSLSRFPARTASAIQAADELAAQHVPNWTAVREQVIEKLIQHPQWLLDAKRAAVRRQPGMSGASVRPPTQSEDEAYWDRVKAAGKRDYGT